MCKCLLDTDTLITIYTYIHKLKFVHTNIRHGGNFKGIQYWFSFVWVSTLWDSTSDLNEGRVGLPTIAFETPLPVISSCRSFPSSLTLLKRETIPNFLHITWSKHWPLGDSLSRQKCSLDSTFLITERLSYARNVSPLLATSLINPLYSFPKHYRVFPYCCSLPIC